MTEIRIDELARRSGLTVDTIRFYQREGLLPPAARAGRAKVYGSYSLADLVERSGGSAELAARLHDVGLLRDPAEFGRATYDATDLDVLRAVVELQRLGLPDDVLVELASIYVDGVEAMQLQVFELFSGKRGQTWSPEELSTFQDRAATSAGQLLPLVTRIVEYVHLRTLQRVTLGAIERSKQT